MGTGAGGAGGADGSRMYMGALPAGMSVAMATSVQRVAAASAHAADGDEDGVDDSAPSIDVDPADAERAASLPARVLAFTALGPVSGRDGDDSGGGPGGASVSGTWRFVCPPSTPAAAVAPVSSVASLASLSTTSQQGRCGPSLGDW